MVEMGLGMGDVNRWKDDAFGWKWSEIKKNQIFFWWEKFKKRKLKENIIKMPLRQGKGQRLC